MVSIGIYYGSTTGNTECAALQIGEALGAHVSGVWDIHRREAEELLESDVLLLDVRLGILASYRMTGTTFCPKYVALTLRGRRSAFSASAILGVMAIIS